MFIFSEENVQIVQKSKYARKSSDVLYMYTEFQACILEDDNCHNLKAISDHFSSYFLQLFYFPDFQMLCDLGS